MPYYPESTAKVSMTVNADRAAWKGDLLAIAIFEEDLESSGKSWRFAHS